MNAKKFVLCFIAVIFIFAAINIIMWHVFTKKFFAYYDLNRLGYVMASEALTPKVIYPKLHTDIYEYLNEGTRKSFDVITIGDSFSNGGSDGVFYQDYLAEKYGISSLNFRVINHCIADLYMLISSGLVDEIHPKAVIIESVGREVQGRMGEILVSAQPVSREYIKKNAGPNENISEKISSGILPSVMIKSNMSFLYNKVYTIINPEHLSSEVYMSKLSRDLFTNSGNQDTLIFLNIDLNYLKRPVNADMVNKNLNIAAEILREKGIKLIFMPCVDKYDLYYPYIKDKKGRPENNFFHNMREVSGREYTFIDTKIILQEALTRGEKDLYWFGDTHWSWKGAKLVCDEMTKYLQH